MCCSSSEEEQQQHHPQEKGRISTGPGRRQHHPEGRGRKAPPHKRRKRENTTTHKEGGGKTAPAHPPLGWCSCGSISLSPGVEPSSTGSAFSLGSWILCETVPFHLSNHLHDTWQLHPLTHPTVRSVRRTTGKSNFCHGCPAVSPSFQHCARSNLTLLRLKLLPKLASIQPTRSPAIVPFPSCGIQKCRLLGALPGFSLFAR